MNRQLALLHHILNQLLQLPYVNSIQLQVDIARELRLNREMDLILDSIKFRLGEVFPLVLIDVHYKVLR